MREHKIFLDDIRMPVDAFRYTKDQVYLDGKWIVARNYDKFVALVKTLGAENIEMVSFDHDLAPEHYEDYLQTKNFLAPDDQVNLNYDAFKELTGLDCAKFLIEECKRKDVLLPKIKVHSMNPVGKKNIENLF